MGLQAQRSSGTSPQHPDSAPPPRKMCSTQNSLTQSAVKILYPAACSLLTEFPHRCILVVSAILILKTLPAKWQKQNYTWLSSTSTTTTTVLLASVPAGGLAPGQTSTPNHPRVHSWKEILLRKQRAECHSLLAPNSALMRHLQQQRHVILCHTRYRNGYNEQIWFSVPTVHPRQAFLSRSI